MELGCEIKKENESKKKCFFISSCFEVGAYISYFLYLRAVFHIEIHPFFIAVIVCAFRFLKKISNFKAKIAVNCFVISGIFCADLIAHRLFINGILSISNSVVTEFGFRNSEIVSILKTNGSGVYIAFFSILVLIFTISMLVGRRITLITLFISAFVIQVYFNSDEAVLFSLVFVLFALSLQMGKMCDLPRIYAVFSTFCLIIFIILLINGFDTKIEQSNTIKWSHNLSIKALKTIVYGDNKPEVEIVMSNPEECYIKIETENDVDKVSEYSDTFYWLIREGFSPQLQTKALSNAVDNSKYNKITVNVKSDKTKYVLFPYGVTDYENVSVDFDKIGGCNFEIGKENVYSFEYFSDYLFTPNAIKKTLSNTEENTEISEYLRSEQAYRDFCFSNYTDIDEAEKTVLLSHMQVDKSASVTEKKAEIIETISKTVKAVSDKSAYLSSVAVSMLETDCSGNQQDFARLTVEMLRVCGIPARYCEGYALTSDMIGDSVENSAFTLSAENFHAWAEYYCDGIGWLPFETYPDYVDFCKSDDAYSVVGNEVKSNSDLALGAEEKAESAQENADFEKSDNETDFAKIIWIIIILILLLLFIYVTFVRLRVATRDHHFNRLNISEKAVLRHIQGIALIEKFTDLKLNTPENFSLNLLNKGMQNLAICFESSETVFEKTTYSNETISESDFDLADKFYAETKKEFVRSSTLIKRIYYRFIVGLY